MLETKNRYFLDICPKNDIKPLKSDFFLFLWLITGYLGYFHKEKNTINKAIKKPRNGFWIAQNVSSKIGYSKQPTPRGLAFYI